jgi:TfoX/Sxy family transcriptional regulator of competence genes
MASDQSFAEYVADQCRAAGRISFRRMFGEFALYCDGKVVALICDNQLFVKPTPAGRALLDAPAEAPPFPGARPFLLMRGELDDPESMTALIRATAAALPEPKPRPPGKRRAAAPRRRADK